MYYHFSILLLFRPFIKLKIVGSGVPPRDVCNQAAEAISALVKSYSQLYTLRRTPSFVPYFILTSSIMHLVTLGVSGGDPGPVHQGISDLKSTAESHGFSPRARDILAFLARHWEVENVAAEAGDGDVFETEKGVKRAPKTLGRTRSASMNLFAPNVLVEDIQNGMKPPAVHQSPLFWPFPLQERPLLREGLEEAGFIVLV